jgi:cyclophilin family peptidyl-prolyl cis-trans isomerase/HEAT repeat protein
MRKTAVAALLLLVSGMLACGKHKLRPGEIERNRLFAEALKRSDHREIGPDGFLEHLTLNSPYPEAREWGAVAYAGIGDPAGLPVLYRAMTLPDAGLRAAAAFAVGEIEDREMLKLEGRAINPATVPGLRKLLDDPAPAARMRAAEALGKCGGDAEAAEIAGRMRQIQADPAPSTRAYLELAITALVRLKAAAEVETLRSLAGHPDPGIQAQAAYALYRLEDKAAFPVFRRLLDSPDADVRAHAARGLGICGDQAVPLLLPLLTGQTQGVRVCAVQSLGKLRAGGTPQAIADSLAELPVDEAHPEQINYAAEAASALGDIGTADTIPVLTGLLSAPGAASNAALLALGKVMHAEPERFFAIASRDRHTDPAALRAWARALGELGGTTAVAQLNTILKASFDESGTSSEFLAVPTVLEALSRAQALDLEDTVAAFLKSHEGPVIRAALASYKPGAGVRKPWIPIMDAYNGIASGPDIETKVALLDRLEPWVREPEVAAALEAALKDRARNARITAARLLRAAGRTDVPANPGAAESATTDITYDLLAAYRQDRTVAVIETNRGAMEIELFRQDAPLTVANFISLARRGYFDGLTFMRVVPFFVIQGGDPRNDMEGGPGYSIRCEINMRPYERGSLGMALAGKDTGGSQFFITLAPQPRLDGGYTCFGRVISGMQVADKITAGDRIKKVRIEDDITALDYRQF